MDEFGKYRFTGYYRNTEGIRKKYVVEFEGVPNEVLKTLTILKQEPMYHCSVETLDAPSVSYGNLEETSSSITRYPGSVLWE